MPMDCPTAFHSKFSSFFLFFVYTQLILLLIFLLYYRSVLLIRLKYFLDFFHPNRQNFQAKIVIKEHQDRELFGSIRIYITYKLLPSARGAVKITKSKHSNTLISSLDQDQEIPDRFRGVPLKWVLRVKQKNGFIGRFRKTRYFELCVPQKHLAEVGSLYLQSHVPEEAARITRDNMILRRRREQRTNGAHVGWIPVIAGLLVQLTGCC